MSLLSSNTAFTRYLIHPPPAENKANNIKERIFKGLKANTMPKVQSPQEEMIVGWVPFEKPFKPDFNTDTFTYGVDMLFSLRIDKKKIPAKLVQRELEVATEKKKEEQNRKVISRSEKNELKEQILDQLMVKTPFNSDIHNVCWNLNTNELFFLAGPNAAKEMFETLFLKSFEMKLIPLFAYTLANFKLGTLSNQDKEKLVTLSPSGV
ncbi:MAG: recombination-associated protein RdgC [Desulfobacteraceae bacterium]|nr:recombination-associated protein RdgC [Desulfobacteraceae bacterium]